MEEREQHGELAFSRTLPSILTTHHKRMHPEWTKRTVLLRGWYEAFECANRSYLRSLWWALRLFVESRKFDAVVTGAEHCGMMFAMLQSLFRPPSRRCIHVMIDFPWSARPGRLMMALKVLQMRIAAPAMDAIFAHASPEEAERLTSALCVRSGLFRFVPFHHWLEEPFPESKSEDYIFSGGNSGRDYATLLRALADSDRRTVICTADERVGQGMSLPCNIQIHSVGMEQFHQLMAGSAVVVVPLIDGDIHPAGHTVVVTAMALGKPIIVCAPDEYRCYIENDRTGLLVPPGDADALRQAIERVLLDRALASKLGRNARIESTQFSPEKFFGRVFECVDVAAQGKKARGCSHGERRPR